jgi:sugar O-acyltransferase (sialic acid O-acetyltransferase NeuD family)
MENKKIWPQYTEKMIENVTNILKSGKVNQWTGSKVKEFEKKYTEYFNVKHAVAVTNGTVAIDLCLKAIELQNNDEVIVTPRSFLASASSITTCGGIPVFVDVDPLTQNITLENIKKGVSDKTKAVILVHLAGITCDCEEIVEWCHQNNIYVIEDCAQAHGAMYNGKFAGTFGDINAWSFCQDKIISTGGEGGMITTNNEELYKKAWSYKDHGKSHDKIFKNNNSEVGMFRYIHDNIGTNWRMTEIQASIGLDSLESLSYWIHIRRQNAEKLSNCLKKYPFIQVLEYPDKYYHCYYKYYFYINDDFLGYQQIRNLIIKELNKIGITATQGSCSEIYNEKCYNEINNHKIAMECTNAKQIFNKCIMLQVDPTYTEDIMNDYLHKIDKVLQNINKKIIIIIGCGGHSKVITDVALDSQYFVLGYLDDNLKDHNYRDIKCIGEPNDLLKYNYHPYIICGIGNISARKNIIDKIKKTLTIIHPSAIISQTANIGEGTVVMPKTVINSETNIGNHCIINTGSIVEHNCTVGNNTHIAPGTTICGGVVIGNDTLIGAGTVCKNSTHDKKIKIGNNVTIGCGSVVTKCVDDNIIIYGKI